MKESDLPVAAKRRLQEWKMKRMIDKGNCGGTREESDKKQSLRKNRGIRLLENRKEALEELSKEYQIDGAMEVTCNTQKLKRVTVVDLFRVARTAGQFGMFCACGLVLAMDIF